MVQITAKINSVSSCERSSTEVRKKWSDWSSAIFSKGSKIKQSQQRTGGGSRDTFPLSPLQEIVLDTIGVTAIEGIVGGRDSAVYPESNEMNSANNTSQSYNYLAELDDDSDSSVQFVDVGDSVKSSTPKPLNLKEPTPSMNTNCGKRTTCKALAGGAHSDIIDLEREKLVIKRQRLEIEQSRLDIERERLGVEKIIKNRLEKRNPHFT
ncbi:myb/SANT-like DNA-binding domain-containing protein 4 [Ruditapes philippinarum]|uniref:myb/SANT-like DNA-binding domain-containing protein 4 n=1 Tax=Ruditapes philippinarum TaxID=129788 RepID=UPI00295BA5F5|nr:myb/SANT-like DNA-binding domain-containing protein 4 [Ruditapes philippinarum]